MHVPISHTTALALSTSALLSFALATQNASATEPKPSANGTSASLYFGDINADGLDDALAIDARGAIALLANRGEGRFEDITLASGLAGLEGASCALFTDLDGDGDVDLFLGSSERRLWHNLGNASFEAVTSGIDHDWIDLGVSAVDRDDDGLVDLLVHTEAGDLLYRNHGRDSFERVTLGELAGSAGAVPVSIDAVSGAPAERVGGESRASNRLRRWRESRGAAGTANALSSGTSAGVGSSTSAPLATAANCLPSVRDQSTNNCVVAASMPTLGTLYPLSVDLNVDGAGNVGIGTTTQTRKLEVVGDVAVSGIVTAEQGAFGIGPEATGFASTVSGGQYNAATGDYSTSSGGGDNWAQGFASNISGGFGNRALYDFATVPGGLANSAEGECSLAAGRKAVAAHAGSFVWGDNVDVYKSSSAPNEFSIFAEEGMRVFAVGQTTPSVVVDPSGNLGIGTASPAVALDVSGEVRVRTGDRISFGAVGENGGDTLFFQRLNYAFDSAGMLCVIGSDPDGGASNDAFILATADADGSNLTYRYQFNSNGDALKAGGGSWLALSDRRAKHDIEPLEGALDKVLSLAGKTYYYNDPTALGAIGGKCIGFIAQEVEQVFPEWVSEQADGTKAVGIRGFEALTVESLRELRQEKDEQIAELVAENDELRARVERLEAIASDVASLQASLQALLEKR